MLCVYVCASDVQIRKYDLNFAWFHLSPGMKRDIVDESHSQLVSSLKVKPSDSGASSCIGEADDASCKRIKVTEVNGYIVYTRLKNTQRKNGVKLLQGVDKKIVRSSDEPNAIAKDSLMVRNVVDGGSQVIEHAVQETQLQDSKKTLVDVGLGEETVTDERPGVKTVIDESQLVDVLVVEECHSTKSRIEGIVAVEYITEESLFHGNLVCKEEPISKLRWFSSKERVDGAMVVVAEGDVGKRLGKTPRKFTRLKEESKSVPGADENEVVSFLDMEATEDGAALTTLKNNLELKMSKKIALNKKPTTVKELFETSLLEGVTVIYMGGSKFGTYNQTN